MSLYNEFNELSEGDQKTVLATLEPISDRALEDSFNGMLDEVYGDVAIAGYSYSTSHALKEVDPISYKCGFSDWLSDESETYVELNGEYYLVQDVEKALEELTEMKEDLICKD